MTLETDSVFKLTHTQTKCSHVVLFHSRWLKRDIPLWKILIFDHVKLTVALFTCRPNTNLNTALIQVRSICEDSVSIAGEGSFLIA